MDFSRWLTTWLTRHPLKDPVGMDRASYTREVISKIHARQHPAVSPAPWWQVLLNPPVALAAAAVVVMAVTATLEHSRATLAQQSLRDAARLAESPPGDDEWIQQTMQLLEQLDQDVPGDDAAGSASSSEEEWLKELEMLDEQDLKGSAS